MQHDDQPLGGTVTALDITADGSFVVCGYTGPCDCCQRGFAAAFSADKEMLWSVSRSIGDTELPSFLDVNILNDGNYGFATPRGGVLLSAEGEYLGELAGLHYGYPGYPTT